MNSTPRVVIGAPSSNAGKTTVTLALLAALKTRGENPVSFKCGPDYIDPMFHSRMLGIPSHNLDLFLAGRGKRGEGTVRGLFCQHAASAGIAVTEGVMGFYDGVGVGSEASTYDLARVLDAPVVLVVSAKGAARSLCATISGFRALEADSHIEAVILNNCSPALCKMLKPTIERETGAKVLGCLENIPEAKIGSRHLGLITAEEIDDLKARLKILGDKALETIDLDALMQLAASAAPLQGELPRVQPVQLAQLAQQEGQPSSQPVIAVARDKAFCFYYESNLELLKRLGAKIECFSPLADDALPNNATGLYLGGGYPELYANELAGNASMLSSIKDAVAAGMPTLAECGGFMYLMRELDGAKMVGAIDGAAHETSRLQRFGYITLTAERDTLLCKAGDSIEAHEFHYWDSTANGDACAAQKPNGRSWPCVVAKESLWAGFPHMLFYGNPAFAQSFVQKAAAWQRGGCGAKGKGL